MKLLTTLGSGLVGALVLTALHEVGRRSIPAAPRMDILGMRAIAKTMDKAGQEPPSGKQLHRMAMAGDLVGNSIYYSLVGLGPQNGGTWLRGGILGLLAGLGGVVLPSPLGLGSGPSARTPQTRVLTILWYLAGGLAAAGANQLFNRMMKDR